MKVVNDTSYSDQTPDEVIRVLENARTSRTGLQISYGETDPEKGAVGRDWLEEFDTIGLIGRSTGPVKIPIVLKNAKSSGGFGLLDRCIVRIRTTTGRVFYQHPQYHYGKITLELKKQPTQMANGRTLTVDVRRDGEVHASFPTMEAARRWVRKLGLKGEIVQAAAA